MSNTAEQETEDSAALRGFWCGVIVSSFGWWIF